MHGKKLVAAALVCCSTYASGPEFGKTMLNIHQLFDVCSPERITQFRNQYDTKPDGHGAAFELVLFGGRTTRPMQLAAYFMPQVYNCLMVGEDFSSVTRNFSSNLNALHIGILTQSANAQLLDNVYNLTFESKLCFCPRQEVFGIGLAWQQRFHTSWWFDITVPIQWIRNRLGACETIINAGGKPAGGYTSVLAALSPCNSTLQYGHITNACMSKCGVSQVDLRLGKDLLLNKPYNVGLYAGITAPTGNKPTQRCLFEPQVGMTHWGIMIGSYGGIKPVHTCSKKHMINFLYEAALRYLVPNRERRSFDLIGLPWSRYMAVWPSQDTLPDPTTNAGVQQGLSTLRCLINYSTLCVKVQPHVDFMGNAALNYHNHVLDLELGYNIYARKAETVCFNSALCGNIGLASIKYWLENASHRAPITRTLAHPGSAMLIINDTAGSVDQKIEAASMTDVTYRPLKLTDLDLRSGACPGIFNQTIYAALGKTWDHLTHPVFINGGASYEFACDNTTASRWTAWFKVGIDI